MAEMVKKKVLVTARSFGNVSSEPMDILTQAGFEVVVPPGRSLDSFDEMLAWVNDVDAMIISREKITDAVLAEARQVKVVVKHGVGTDNIDIPAAARRGIIVCNTPGANKLSVAELAIQGMLALSRQILFANSSVRDRRWETIVGQNLTGKTVGIVGLGNIGSSTARMLQGFDCQLLASDPYIPRERFAAAGAEPVTLDELLVQADYVALHVPLTAETRHMIDANALAAMKQTAFLIQVARGGVVDELALAKALLAEDIAGALVDVFEQEPPNPQHPLFSAPNTIFTPHMGAHSRESMNNMSVMAAQNVVDVLSGRFCANIVSDADDQD